MLIVVGSIMLSAVVFIPLLLAALRRQDLFAAGLIQALAVLTVCTGMELVLEGATLIIAAGGALVIFLCGIAILPAKWPTWLVLSGVFTVCIMGLDLVAPLPRYQYDYLMTLRMYHLCITAILGLFIIWLISRAYRNIGSIRVRLLASFVLLVLVPVVIITVCSSIISYQSKQQQVVEQLESVAVLKEAEINNWLRQLGTDLKMSLNEEHAPERLDTLLSGTPGTGVYNDAYRHLQERFRETIKHALHFEEIFLIDSNGLLILSSNETKKGEFRGLQSYFSKGLTGPGTFVQTQSFSSRSEGVNSVVSVCPVVDRYGKTIGVLAGRAGMSTLNKIIQERTGLGASGETILVGSNHVLLTASRFPGYPPGGTYIHTMEVTSALARHKNGSGLYEDYRRVPVILTYRWLPELDVALIAKQDQSEAFHSIYVALGLKLAIALAAAFLAVLASLAIIRSIAKPISNLVEAAESITAGNLNVTAPIERNDEVGALADAFNKMAVQVRQMMQGLLTAKERAEDAVKKAEQQTEETRASNLELEREVVERKLVEAALVEQVEFGRTLRDTIPNPVLYKDINGVYLGCNKAFENYLALSQNEIVGKTVWDLHPEEKAAIYYEQDRELFANPGVQAFETVIRYADDSDRTVILYKATYADSDGNPAGLVGVVLDITERKRAEEEKLKLEAQLLQAKKMESIGVLAGGIAHDFNNLLTAITGYGETIRDSIPQGDEFLQLGLEQIMRAAGRAAELTKSLLVFSRKQTIKPKPVLIDKVIRETSQLIRRIIGEDIEFDADFASEKLVVMGDSGQLGQVLMNLATNARDAMPDGGQLHISAQRVVIEDGAEAMFELPVSGKYVMISVSDTGSGIDVKSMERIFEPFFTTKQDGKGTGLGLAIIHGIIKQHNGSILVNSEVGKGSTFQIHLPLLEGVVEDEIPQVAINVSGGTETLLVIEDECVVAMFMKKTLERAGYTVLVAADGDEAVAKFKEYKDTVALVLSDVVMPKKNGKEIYHEIKTLKPGTKIIFVSGYTSDIICSKGIIEAEVDFIPKPFAKNDLLQKVREVLDRQV